jgi:hypothetical protein
MFLVLASYAGAVVMPCPEVALFDAAAIALGTGDDAATPPEFRTACPCGCHHAPATTSVAGIHQWLPPVAQEPRIPGASRPADAYAGFWSDPVRQVPDTIPRTRFQHS